MAHESFENEEIARILNEYFVAIKVDREERPDVDRVYMTYVQATTGGGGWPMSVWLTPDLKPFLGGTYFPPEEQSGQPGFKTILLQIADAWKNKREQIISASASVTHQLQEAISASNDFISPLGESLLEEGYQQIKASYEPHDGGFGGAPKFPRPVVYNFMLRYYARTLQQDDKATPQQARQTDDTSALDMVLFTLHKMADGGIHDHIGGGFHRYSVDTFWHVPHFEKMLYDQAQLACSYLDAYQITREPFYADMTRDILDYVLRDMTGPDGQFYSAEDADSPIPDNPSEHAEGAFYVWDYQEITNALGSNNAEVFDFYYGVEPDGNVVSDPHGEFRNKNILKISHTMEDTASKFNISPADISEILSDARTKLSLIRSQRPRPHLDDKTLTAWNGLMISAFARASQVLDEPRYLISAKRAATFIEKNMYNPKSGTLLRRYRAGEAMIEGYQDDYAFFIQSLLDLYEASFDINFLTWAIALQKKQDILFWDRDGGYFSTTGNDPSILLRIKDDYDGAEPSGNSIAVMNLLRLSQMTDNTEFRKKAELSFAAVSSRLDKTPHAMPHMLAAYDFYFETPIQIIIAGHPGSPDTQAMLREVNSHFIPNKILLLAEGGIGQKSLSEFMEFITSVKMIDGKATAYVCRNHVCKEPTTDIATMASLLHRFGHK